jgi:sugar lactone lactonase YvrE
LAQGLPTNYVLNGPEPDLNGIAVDSTGVYFTTWDGVSQGAVLKVPLTGGTPTTLATGTFPYGLAVNSSGVYFSDSKAGTILTAPLDGGVTVTIASGQLVPFAVAMDSTNVYWTNLGGAADGGAVLQVAKP